MLSSMARSLGGGFGSRISNIPLVRGRLDESLARRSRRLVRENRAHHESLRRMGWLGGRLASMIDVVRGPGERGGSKEVREVKGELSKGLMARSCELVCEETELVGSDCVRVLRDACSASGLRMCAPIEDGRTVRKAGAGCVGDGYDSDKSCTSGPSPSPRSCSRPSLGSSWIGSANGST